MAPEDSPPRLEIDWLKTVAGALAAVSSAVLLSTLGAAGTVIGAAVGSVVVTVGSSLYGQGLLRSRQRLGQVQLAGPRRDEMATAESQPSPGRLRGRLGQLPWKRIALAAAALFLITLAAITAFEVVAGRSVSSFTGGSAGSGGTTLTRLGGGGTDPQPDQQPSSPTTSEPTPGVPTRGVPTTGEPTTGETGPAGTPSGGTPFQATPSETTPTDGTSPPSESSTTPAPGATDTATLPASPTLP